KMIVPPRPRSVPYIVKYEYHGNLQSFKNDFSFYHRKKFSGRVDSALFRLLGQDSLLTGNRICDTIIEEASFP
ncbi:MAG: hypothetical protein VB045_01320, partial [Synergistaceae bacterium]|nr:hypothetical protein [Synergistaceae bacterium]